MTDLPELPKELFEALGGQLKPGRPYTARDHVLAKINNSPDGVTANELVIYLYYVQKEKLTKRAYLYHILSKLRRQGLIRTTSMSVPGVARNFITSEGMKTARAEVVVPAKRIKS